MTANDQDPNIETPNESPSEEGETQTLNRAERRALAKGKKAPAANVNPMQARLNEFRNAANRNVGPGNSRIPRTGHKG